MVSHYKPCRLDSAAGREASLANGPAPPILARLGPSRRVAHDDVPERPPRNGGVVPEVEL